MTSFFDTIFSRYPIKTRRFLELVPGLLVWTLILLPIYGSFFFPVALAYFILFFDVYALYKSLFLVVTAYQASKRIKQAEKENWAEKAAALPQVEKVSHVLVIPNYKENVNKLRTTLQALTKQSFPLKQIYIVLAMEEREEEAKAKSAELIAEFKPIFGDVFASFHPDVIGEVKGKSSNEAFGGRLAYKKLFESKKLDINYATVSSVDADSIFDKQYFAYVTYKFLTNEKKYNTFWQSATVYYNNTWQVPAPTRIISFFGSLWRTSILIQGDRLIVNATYTLSFKLLKDIDFWDVDVIPEDYRIFFKAFYKKQGEIWVEPVFLKTSMDAALSKGYINSLKNKYEQERRWSWGVSDMPLFIKWWLTVPNVPFFRKTLILYHVFLDHLLWPSNWFIITVAANILPLINPIFSRTSLGYNLPRFAGFILTTSLVGILAMIVIDFRNRPLNMKVSKTKQFLFPLEFILLPIIGFFLGALPALISHTQLMFGKRIEYKVTEKV